MERFLLERLSSLMAECPALAVLGIGQRGPVEAASAASGPSWLPPGMEPLGEVEVKTPDDLVEAARRLDGDATAGDRCRLESLVGTVAALLREPSDCAPDGGPRWRGAGYLFGARPSPAGRVLAVEFVEPARAGSTVRTAAALCMVGGRSLADDAPILARAARALAAGCASRYYVFDLDEDADAGEPTAHVLSCGEPAGAQNTHVPGLRRRCLCAERELPASLPGPAVLLPPPPPAQVRGPHVEELIEAMLAAGPSPTAVMGPPGIGKGAACLVALHDDRVKERFGGRRYFVRCDAVLTGAGVLGEVARAVGLRPGPDLLARLFDELARARALLILDALVPPWVTDTDGTEDVVTGLSRIDSVSLVATLDGTRRPLGPRWQRAILVQPVGMAEARALLGRNMQSRSEDDPRLDDLLLAQEGVPLCIEILARIVEAWPDLDEVFGQWRSVRARLVRDLGWTRGLSSLTVTVGLAVERLTDDARRLLSLAPVFPHGIAHANLESLLPGAALEAAETLRA